MNEEYEQQALMAERLKRQIAMIEQTIVTLMEDIDFSELSSAQRLSFTIRLMNQQVKTLQLQQQCEKVDPHDRQRELLSSLMRKMRGEEEEEEHGTHTYTHINGGGFVSNPSPFA